MNWTGRYCLVVSNGVLKNSSDVFSILDPDVGGTNTFTVPLSADGTGDPTHWAAYTPLQVETRDALLNMTTTEFKTYVDQLAQERGREPAGSITAFKNDLQMSAEDANPWDFIASLGLQRIVPDTI